MVTTYNEAKITGRLKFKVCRVYQDVKADNAFSMISRSRSEQPVYEAECYEGQFLENIPEGKYDYYTRKGDDQMISHVMKDKEQVFGFWGTIVTDEPLDFIPEGERKTGDIINEGGTQWKVISGSVAEIECISYTPI